MKKLIYSAIALLILASCSKAAPDRTATQAVSTETATVSAAVVQTRDIPDSYAVVGTVEARDEAVVSARVMGDIHQVLVAEGFHVEKGDILLTIDDSDILAKKQEAVSARDEGLAGLAEADAAISEARAAVDNAAINSQRFENLYKDNAVTKKELDDITTQKKMAEAKLEQALAAKNRTKARVAQADSSIKQIEIMQGYTVIHAPIPGVVTQKLANAGEVAAPGRPLIKIVGTANLRLNASVKETELAGTLRGQTVKVGFDALPGKDAVGIVSEVIPAADPSTRSFTVKVSLPVIPGLLPGMFGRLYMPSGIRKAVMAPAAAVFTREGVQSVYVISPDNSLILQTVRVGTLTDGMVEIISGLSGGEKVAVGDMSRLKDGMKVAVR